MRTLTRKLIGAVSAVAVFVGLAWAEDVVEHRTSKIPLRGQITSETSNELTIQRKDPSEKKTVPVNELENVKYDGDVGTAVNQAYISFEKGGESQKAADAYAKAAGGADAKGLAVAAAKFGRARSLVRLAQRDPARADEAIKALEEFRKEQSNTRFHYALHEMLGQLYLSQGKAQPARDAFVELAKAPWSDYHMKAKVYDGRVLLAGGKYTKATAVFDELAKSEGDSSEEKLHRQEAVVGKCECLVKQKKYEDAEKTLLEVIESTPGDESAVHAPAFNLLGDVYRETGKPKEAIRRYLYVDALLSGERSEHAKALAYLAQLWDQIGRPDRAEESRARLRDSYPNSPWAKQLGETTTQAESKSDTPPPERKKDEQ